MVTFRGIVILGGLNLLGLLWGSFLWVMTEQVFDASIDTLLWSVVVCISFLIIIRVWDAWFNIKKVKEYEQHISNSTD